MKDFNEDILAFDDKALNGGRRLSQPRRQIPSNRKPYGKKVQHGEAEIGLVMEIKRVSRAKAIRILDERAARLKAARAKAKAEAPFDEPIVF